MTLVLPHSVDNDDPESVKSLIEYLAEKQTEILVVNTVPNDADGIDMDARLFDDSAGDTRLYFKINGSWVELGATGPAGTNGTSAAYTGSVVPIIVQDDATYSHNTTSWVTFASTFYFYIDSVATNTLQVRYEIRSLSGGDGEARINVNGGGIISTGVAAGTGAGWLALTETLDISALAAGFHFLNLQLKLELAGGSVEVRRWTVCNS